MAEDQKNDIAYLVFDVESVPDARLIKSVKYPGEELTDNEAIEKLQGEILETTEGKTSFIPVTFQLPICVVVAKVDDNFLLKELVSLDEGKYRPAEITRKFWYGVEELYKKASLVTFNGRGFDVPLLELMAFRYGYVIDRHLVDKFGTRYRFGNRHLDLQEYLSNYMAYKMAGGLNLLAKALGKPGKTDTSGDEVYSLYRDNKLEKINTYCIHDVLDTYFIFLRTRVMLGKITLDEEKRITLLARELLMKDAQHKDAAALYFSHISPDFEPWP
jgi:predicted PolB exonuclease-like 3'-5' exonuclease